MPPPSTQPFSAAMTGFRISRTNAAYSMRSRNAMISDRSASALRSLPAENARSPAPADRHHANIAVLIDLRGRRFAIPAPFPA